MTALMAGVAARRVPTARLTQNVLETGRTDGPPVLFVHGNVSSSLFWQPTMLALPAPYRPLAVDLRGFGDTDPVPVDATRGVRDWSDDLAALLDALGLDRVHLVGWSLGGGVVMQSVIDAPDRVASLTLVAPVSPYGFGGTRGPAGTPVDADGTGTGGGAANPEFVQRLAAGDRGCRLAALAPQRAAGPLRRAAVRARAAGRVGRVDAVHPHRRRLLPRHGEGRRRLARDGVRRPRRAATRSPPPTCGSTGCPLWTPSRRCCGSAAPPT